MSGVSRACVYFLRHTSVLCLFTKPHSLTLISVFRLPGFIVPPIPFISAGPNHGFWLKRKSKAYTPTHIARQLTWRSVIDKFGTDIYSCIGVLPVTSCYIVSDLEALKVKLLPSFDLFGGLTAHLASAYLSRSVQEARRRLSIPDHFRQ
jgi:hypothetical protein